MLVRAVAALLVVWVIGVAFAIVWVRVRSAPHMVMADAAPARPIVIVLGAKVWDDGIPSPALVVRLERARALFLAGKAERILVSGRREGSYDEPTAMQRWLEEHGVPSEVIVQDAGGYRTQATMQRAARDFGIRKALVTTHAYHLPRSLYLAEKAGIDALGVPADTETTVTRWSWRVREAASTFRAVLESL